MGTKDTVDTFELNVGHCGDYHRPFKCLLKAVEGMLWWPPINRAVKVALFFIIALELLTTNLVQDTKFLERTFLNHDNYFATHGHAGGGIVVNHVLNCTSNDILPNGWCMEEESQTPRYFLDTDNSSNKENHAPAVSGDDDIVTIQHYTHKGYEMCLANKTIVFIGDSRVRYQYMNLAHFLMSPLSRFMRCDDNPTCKKGLTQPDKDCYLIGDGRGGGGGCHGKIGVRIVPIHYHLLIWYIYLTVIVTHH
jgi:hypothetical protein